MYVYTGCSGTVWNKSVDIVLWTKDKRISQKKDGSMLTSLPYVCPYDFFKKNFSNTNDVNLTKSWSILYNNRVFKLK